MLKSMLLTIPNSWWFGERNDLEVTCCPSRLQDFVGAFLSKTIYFQTFIYFFKQARKKKCFQTLDIKQRAMYLERLAFPTFEKQNLKKARNKQCPKNNIWKIWKFRTKRPSILTALLRRKISMWFGVCRVPSSSCNTLRCVSMLCLAKVCRPVRTCKSPNCLYAVAVEGVWCESGYRGAFITILSWHLVYLCRDRSVCCVLLQVMEETTFDARHL